MYLIGIAPVKHKFRHQLFGKAPVDVGHGQNVEAIRRWLPVVADAGRQWRLIHRGGKARPLLAYVLNEFAVPGFKGVTAFGPVEHEFGHGIGNKLRINAGPLQNLAGIAVWLPVERNRCGFVLCWIKGGAL